MAKRLWLCGGFIIFCFVFVMCIAGVCFAEDAYVLFLLDASGSMSEQLEGKVKIDIAKEALSSVLSEIPDDIALGMRVYGATYDQTLPEEENCKATELIVPIGKGTKDSIRSRAFSYSPKGYTPIALSLSKAPQDFPSVDAKRYIILISDGKETCGGDPVAEINRLKLMGFKVVIHTVGFNVDEQTRLQLQQIASAGGGMYLDAKNSAELGSSLKVIVEDVRKKKEFTTTAVEGKMVEPGSNIETAPLISAGIKYESDMLPGEMLFYKIQAKKGQEIEVLLQLKKSEEATGIFYLNTFDRDYVELGGTQAFFGRGAVVANRMSLTGRAEEDSDIYLRLKGDFEEKIGYAIKVGLK
jgi:hypothetical protein